MFLCSNYPVAWHVFKVVLDLFVCYALNPAILAAAALQYLQGRGLISRPEEPLFCWRPKTASRSSAAGLCSKVRIRDESIPMPPSAVSAYARTANELPASTKDQITSHTHRAAPKLHGRPTPAAFGCYIRCQTRLPPWRPRPNKPSRPSPLPVLRSSGFRNLTHASCRSTIPIPTVNLGIHRRATQASLLVPPPPQNKCNRPRPVWQRPAAAYQRRTGTPARIVSRPSANACMAIMPAHARGMSPQHRPRCPVSSCPGLAHSTCYENPGLQSNQTNSERSSARPSLFTLLSRRILRQTLSAI